jgi:Nickel responsive protein SCO4226-like
VAAWVLTYVGGREGHVLPRYLVERTFPDGLQVPHGIEGREVLGSIIACNGDRSVTWIHSFVSLDRTRTFCVYDAPSPEAVRLTAKSNGLPVDRITQISVLDPYAYHVS